MDVTTNSFLSNGHEIGIIVGIFLFIVSGIISWMLPRSIYKFVPSLTITLEIIFIVVSEAIGKSYWAWTKDVAKQYGSSAVHIWLLGAILFFAIPIFRDRLKNGPQ